MEGVAARRLAAQGLTGAGFATPTEVVRRLGAVQAQDYAAAKWAVALRCGATNAELDALLAAGTLVRTHVLRPTWHLVLPEDLRWMLAATRDRVHRYNGTYYRKLGLDDATLRRGDAVLGAALKGGHTLTRPELAEALTAEGFDCEELRLTLLVMHAELEGVICSGGLRGKQHTYAHFDERVPEGPSRSREEALARLAERYFTSHGPALEADFAWWSGLTLADAREAMARADGLRQEMIGDKPYWVCRPAPEVAAGPHWHLLPNFDEYTVAYQDREALEAPASAPMDLLARHLVLHDGRMAGVWTRRIEKQRVVVDVPPGVPRAAVERYARFLELPPG